MYTIIDYVKLLQPIKSRFAGTWWIRRHPWRWTTKSTMVYTTVDWQLH